MQQKQEQQDRKEIEKESKQGAKTSSVATTTRRRKRVLVIDDEKEIAALFRLGLEQSGFEVDTFDDPSEALENFKPIYYDIVISDVRMPEMSGFELCRELLKIDNKVKIFFVSAYDFYSKELKRQFPSLDN